LSFLSTRRGQSLPYRSRLHRGCPSGGCDAIHGVNYLAGDPVGAEKFFAKAYDLEQRASRFQELSLDHESLSTDKLEQSANETNFDEQ
jgi:hypothetical protein